MPSKRPAREHIQAPWPVQIIKETYPGWWCSCPSEKYESQLGWLSPIYGKNWKNISHVPNHQPVPVEMIQLLWMTFHGSNTILICNTWHLLIHLEIIFTPQVIYRWFTFSKQVSWCPQKLPAATSRYGSRASVWPVAELAVDLSDGWSQDVETTKQSD